MKDKENWEKEFELCIYANKLLNFLSLMNQEYKSSINIHQVKKAIYYARKYHGNQMRKSGEPFYSHPI
jgi:(p)ppGpp synthase/HD superfamily hydrolase